jgi:hypothetical protein
MRSILSLLAAAAALALSAASAQTVAVKSVSIAPSLQSTFDETYGQREADYLKTEILDRLGKEFAQEGLTLATGTLATGPADFVLSVSLDAAKPNRPTFQQLLDTPGLDYGRSFGIGGAAISARLERGDGALVREIARRWYDSDIEFADTKSTWHDAQRVIRQFADEAARAAAAARPGGQS